MMIGGFDIVLPNETRDDAEALDAVVRATTRRWAGALFEDPDTGRLFVSIEALALAGVRELFLYRDQAARAAWERDGYTDEFADAMIHAISLPGELTLVVNDPEERVAKAVIDEVTSFLGHGLELAA